MNDDFSTALDICRRLIGNKPSIRDSEITEAIKTVKEMSKFAHMDYEQLKKELLSIYNITVDNFRILENKERKEPWLENFKADQKTDWPFWKRYIKYLHEGKNLSPATLNQLNNLTDNILDKLFNPLRSDILINKRGLVVGQVQSGKTANYIGLICKAADAGFNFIVVLAGIHNNLRSQTQTRIDEGFLGFDTQNERAYTKNKTTKIGVGLIPGFDNAIANSYTTSLDKGDFTSRSANTAGFNFNNPAPIILVVKKNISVLKRLFNWLTNQCDETKRITNKSFLLIDDEADNASINTNKDDFEPTKINNHIRNIISLFNKSAYVGYTATPFANIFIPLKEDDNLFPRDFIINLPAPTNYIGPEKVFGTSTTPNEVDDDVLPIVFPIDDYLNFVPQKHKKDDPKPSLKELPKSLAIAIQSFIITCAIRIARGQADKHNSMLIHVSRFKAWQDHIKLLIEELFTHYKQEIEANDKKILEEFRCILEKDDSNYTSYKTITSTISNSTLKAIDSNLKVHNWDEIKPLLYKAVQKIRIKSINGTSGDSLTYYEYNKTGISVIAIGGDKLSRGLTLEGLSISYFLRASKMYDTLMQMGRWFGYRQGYVDLCRLFTSPELNEWYRHITMASEELKSEFNYLAESGGTPENYALKVRKHPGCLQITALNKMRYTNEIELSWAGRLIETYQLSMDKGEKNSNLVSTDDLLCSLGEITRKEEKYYLWKNISYEKICDFFLKFKVAKNLKKVDFKLIVDYIQKLASDNELTSWSIVLMTKKDATAPQYQFSNGIKINVFDRNRASDTDKNTYYIRKNHIIGNPQDEFIDLDEKIISSAIERTKKLRSNWEKKYPAPEIVRQEFRSKSNPLLIIYPLNPECANPKNNNENDSTIENYYQKTDPPFIGLAISFPSSKQNIGVLYKVNQIAEFAETEDMFNIENDNTNND